MTTLRAVCFDVDYTIMRPGAAFEADGYGEIARVHGLPVGPDRWRDAEAAVWDAVRARREELGDRHDPQLIDAVARAVLRTLCDGHDVPPGALDAAVAQVAAAWLDLRNFTLYNDVEPCLAAIDARGLKVALISNTERDLDGLVAHFGLGSLVDATVASRQVGRFKPAAAVFQAALDRLVVPAAQTVMVGDSLHDDIGGALACGFAAAVHLDRSRGRQPRAEVRPPGHELTIHSLADLPAVLDALEGDVD